MISRLFLLSILFLPQTRSVGFEKVVCDADEKAAISNSIKKGDLSGARFLAQHALQTGCNEVELAELFQQQADAYLDHGGHLAQPTIQLRPRARSDDQSGGCWNFSPDEYVLELWDQCCSEVPVKNDVSSGFLGEGRENDDTECYREKDGGTRMFMCCEFARGSSSYLRLPALKELSLRLRVDTEAHDRSGTVVKTDEIYDLEQDGFLRKFDAAGILWPTGYLLSLCVAAPRTCGVPELYEAIAGASIRGNNTNYPVAIELGSGIGAPSIALARTLERVFNYSKRAPAEHSLVLATDKALQGLALTTSNSHAANALVKTAQLDHYNVTTIMGLRQEHGPSGFAIVLGSSLQAMFDESTHDKDHHLWSVLDLLLDSSNPNAIALLAHTIQSLQPPNGGTFQRIRTISGNHFGMTTRHGDSSDFEISIFRRRRQQDQEL